MSYGGVASNDLRKYDAHLECATMDRTGKEELSHLAPEAGDKVSCNFRSMQLLRCSAPGDPADFSCQQGDLKSRPWDLEVPGLNNIAS